MDNSDQLPKDAKSIEAVTCLERVLASPPFVQSERLQRFLAFIVTETLAGHADRLKGYTIGIEVFDRDESFDPAIDAIVRVEATRLRAKLREYYDAEGRDDPVRFELPKGRYSVHIDHQWGKVSTGSSAPSRRMADASWAVTAYPQPIEDRPSVAVLPFANMSGDAGQEYFADGITESLITELSRLPGLFVISRQSSFVYKTAIKRAEEISRELGVKYLLEGGVQRAGSRVRITAQLIDGATGVHLWGERYDRELTDIFALQDQVIQRILAVLRVRLTDTGTEGVGHEGTRSVEAHDCLLRGLERFWLFSQQPVEEARGYFARAVELDPAYAAAHAWLARALAFQWIMYWDASSEALEQAFDHARTAVDLDPQLPLAYSVLSWVQRWRGHGEEAIAAGLRAVNLDPNNADAHLFLSFALSASGRAKEGLHYIEKGMRLNPHPSTVYQLALGQCHYVLEDYTTAIAAFEHGVELRDVFYSNHYYLCLVYTLLGREEEAKAEREKLLALTGGRRPVLRVMWLDDDLRRRFEEHARRLGL
ncbi:MAG: adenylate cyclase [Vicinamibacterales bacterium]